MKKLTAYYFYELTKEQQRRVTESFIDNGGNEDYLNGKFSRDEVNVEVVVDEDGTLYDFRVFDPFQLVDKELYVYADGWSNWLLEYSDNAGHDVDEILDEFDGVPQDD